MKDIDLTSFAYHSQKLPSKFLNHLVEKKRTKTATILSSHFIDFFLCLMTSTTLASIYNFSIRGLLVTKGLRSAFAAQDTTFLAMLMLPLVIFSYFFSCYFLNHGQTFGMYWHKKRVEMKYKDYQETYQWAFESLILLLTGGISFLVHFKKWESCQDQDYLYQDLILLKESYAIDLLAMTEESIEEIEEFKQAA